MSTVVVVGNPRTGSRTRTAAEALARALAPDPSEVETIELADLGPGLLAWGESEVEKAVESVRTAQLAVIASPTFKGTYTGLLKLFLDQFPGDTGLQDVVVVPMMLGGSPAHSLAVDVSLRPVLVELGACCPSAGLYQVDSSLDDESFLNNWLLRWSATIERTVINR